MIDFLLRRSTTVRVNLLRAQEAIKKALESLGYLSKVKKVEGYAQM